MLLMELYFLPESTEKNEPKEKEAEKKEEKYYDHCQTGN
jgi:hypothetical protein